MRDTHGANALRCIAFDCYSRHDVMSVFVSLARHDARCGSTSTSCRQSIMSGIVSFAILLYRIVRTLTWCSMMKSGAQRRALLFQSPAGQGGVPGSAIICFALMKTW